MKIRLPRPRVSAQAVRNTSVTLVALVAAVISYQHIYHLAITHGQGRLASALLALCVDGAVVVATSSMMRAAGIWLWWARGLLVLSVGATLAANVAYGLPFGPAGAVISGWPAVAVFGCAELAIGMACDTTPAPARKPARKPAVVPADKPGLHSVPDENPYEAARQAYRESVASGTPLSRRKLGKMFDRSGQWGADRIREATS